MKIYGNKIDKNMAFGAANNLMLNGGKIINTGCRVRHFAMTNIYYMANDRDTEYYYAL